MSDEMAATSRFSQAGDEFLFVELNEEMTLEAFFRSISITQRLRDIALPGVVEICPANASYQVRYDPDVISAQTLQHKLEALEQEVASQQVRKLETRIIEVPVLYNDPWTHETLMRFRDHHQDPSGTDLEYAARINGYDTVDAFINSG